MPFATIGGAMLAFAIMTALQKFGVNENSFYYQYIGKAISNCAFGYMWSLIAYDMAPSGKLISATVMTTIISVLYIGISILTWILPGFLLTEAIQSSIGCVAMIIGCVVAIKQADS